MRCVHNPDSGESSYKVFYVKCLDVVPYSENFENEKNHRQNIFSTNKNYQENNTKLEFFRKGIRVLEMNT